MVGFRSGPGGPVGLSRFSLSTQVPGADCQNLFSLGKGDIPRGEKGAVGKGALTRGKPGPFPMDWFGSMGAVGISGGGSSKMDLTGVGFFRVPLAQKGQVSL